MAGTRGGLIALFAGALLALLPAAGLAAPIQNTGPEPSLPVFEGRTFEPRPIKGATRSPQNPFLAPDPYNNIHNDSWMTDAYPGPGPTGRNPEAPSTAGSLGLCATLGFDAFGRIVSVCPSLIAPPQARIIDPVSLETIASLDLPNAPPIADGSPGFQDYTGGGYFFLDQNRWLWVPTKTNRIQVLEPLAGSDGFALRREIDLSKILDPEKERITSILPDFAGRVWFVGKQRGTVGIWNRKTGKLAHLRLGEKIQNSFAVDRSAVYIVSEKRLYRFGVSAKGRPRIDWKATYRTTGRQKPGQADTGSGTTPTVMKGGFVTITDNADPMNIVVYRTARKLPSRKVKRGKKGRQRKVKLKRKVCEVPVFRKGAGATENSLVTTGRSIVVENNYGYSDPFSPGGDQVISEPGFARVDIAANGRSCRRIWTNQTVRAPTVVPKMSTRTGLIYAYSRPPDQSDAQGYYWTAIDFRNGKTVFSQFAGSGLLFNNNYAGITLGPDGTAYLGVIGGIVALRDSDS